MVPLAFIASAVVAANVRRHVHRNHRLVTPAIELVSASSEASIQSEVSEATLRYGSQAPVPPSDAVT